MAQVKEYPKLLDDLMLKRLNSNLEGCTKSLNGSGWQRCPCQESHVEKQKPQLEPGSPGRSPQKLPARKLPLAVALSRIKVQNMKHT